MTPMSQVTELSRVRDEQGVVLPTRLLALCISAVAVAALVFVANDPDKAPTDQTATPAVSEPSATPSATATTTPEPAKPSEAEAEADQAGRGFVVVFNNTRTKGLAGGVAGKAKSAGWNVVGSDNWYGTVDGTSVYFPPRLKAGRQGAGQRPRHQATPPGRGADAVRPA